MSLLEAILWDSALIVLVVVTCLYLYSLYKYNYWAKNNIAYIKPSFPFGNCGPMITKKLSFGNQYECFYNEFKKRKAPFGGFYFAFRPEFMIIDLDILKKIMIKDFHHFTDRGMFNDPENDPLSGNLFSLDGTAWKNMRVKLTPTFTSGKMKMMFPTLVSCSDELNNILTEKESTGEPMDIKEYLARFTTDVIGSCAFGIDCNCLRTPDTEFRKYGQMVFEPRGIDVFRQIGSFLMPGFFKTFKIRGMNKTVTNFFTAVVTDTIRYREENNIYRKDFIQLLLQLKNEGSVKKTNLTDDELTDEEGDAKVTLNGPGKKKETLSIDQIVAQCFVFFAAGFETSSTTMSFCLYELVKNPEIQTKLREEINRVLKKYGGKLSYEAIMEMKYLDQVVHETLRKYPPLPHLIRKCTANYPLPGSNYVIRKGDVVVISVLGIHRDPEVYPEPLKFDPERFSDEQKAARHPMAWLPFGEGPRNCIGLRFGLMETKVGLSVLLKNHRFTLNGRTKEPVMMDPNSFTMSTLGGIWLDVHKV